MKKAKILIATGIYPPDIGGPATMIEEMTVALQKQGFSCSVLAYGDEDCFYMDGNDPLRYRVERVGKKRNPPFRQLLFFTKLLKAAKSADLIYVTDTYSVGLSALLAKILIGIPYVVRFAGDSAWELASSAGAVSDDLETFQHKKYHFLIELRKAMRRAIMCNADHVIAVSCFMQKIASLIGVKRENCSLIYNSVDFLNNFGINIPQKNISLFDQKRAKGSIIIGTACRLTAWKGVDTLLKSASILKSSKMAFEIIVMGEGPEREKLENLAKQLDLEKHVHFTGRIKQSEMPAYLASLDIFVLCSRYEGLSHTILQAMQAKTPVIASQIGGNLELVENEKSGLLVPLENEKVLAEAINRLANNADFRRQLVENASAKLEQFSWKKAVSSTCSVLNKVLCSRGA